MSDIHNPISGNNTTTLYGDRVRPKQSWNTIGSEPVVRQCIKCNAHKTKTVVREIHYKDEKPMFVFLCIDCLKASLLKKTTIYVLCLIHVLSGGLR